MKARMETRRTSKKVRSVTSGTAGTCMSSTSESGSSSYPFGSGLGPAAPLSLGNILYLRVTRNPRMNMH
jgi:hypothetical protein